MAPLQRVEHVQGGTSSVQGGTSQRGVPVQGGTSRVQGGTSQPIKSCHVAKVTFRKWAARASLYIERTYRSAVGIRKAVRVDARKRRTTGRWGQ